MKYRAIVLVFSLLLSAATLGLAEDIYVAQQAQGNDSGDSASSAHSLAWLNNSSNWGAGVNKVSPGDTVHLVGTLTSTLTVRGSGTPGNPVTLYFELGANFTSPCWASTGAIQINGASWITVDGGVNGLIQNTDNGTTNTIQANSRGIGGGGNGTATLYNGVIKNLTITNMYTKTKGVWDTTRYGYPIDVSGSSITISNCAVSDADCGISYSATETSQSNIFILNNRVLNCNHSIGTGMADANCYLTNLVIAGNYMDHWDVWDAPGDTAIHLDGLYIINNTYATSSLLDGFRVYGNTFGGYVGTRTTSSLFINFQNVQNQLRNLFIYNNLFLCYPPGNWGNGFIICGGSNVWVFNNTCVGTVTNGIGYGGGINFGGTDAHCYNNLLLSGSGLTVLAYTYDTVNAAGDGAGTESVLTNYFRNIWSDHNVIFGREPTFQVMLYKAQPYESQWVSGLLNGLGGWQTWYGNNRSMSVPIWNAAHADPHSVNNLPRFKSGTYVPATDDTVARGTGTNLTFLGVTADFYGNPRPTSGAWTIGAFEVAGTNLPPLDPLIGVTPATQNFGSIAPGTIAERTFTVQNTGGGTLSGSATVSAPFSVVSGSPYNLGAAQSQPVVVRYSPTAAGNDSQNVVFTGGGGATGSAIGTASVVPAIAVTPGSQNFGAISVGASVDLPFTVQNTGGGTLSGSVTVSAPFSVVSGTPYSLGAGQSQVVVIRYSPTVDGNDNQNVVFTGGGGATRSAIGSASVPPAIAVTPGSQNFGAISAGASADLPFTVQNAGGGTLSGSASVPAPFSVVSGSPYSLGAGQSQTVVIRYSPTAAGNDNQNAVFTGAGGATRPVTGSAFPAIAPLTFRADSGLVTQPFVTTNGYLYQPIGTDLANSGRASYRFTVTESNLYVILTTVDAPGDGANSFFINVDAEPQDPYMVWDIPITSGLEQRTVSWRGNGTWEVSDFVPKVFALDARDHELIIRGREGNVRLDGISIIKVTYPAPPTPRAPQKVGGW